MNILNTAKSESGLPADRDPRWAAVVARDRTADGKFFYSVKTTGVYCRPSCASRLANPKNVRFHATAAEAEAAGFRACKRCRPDAAAGGPHANAVAAACRSIEAADTMPTLASLAQAAGLSPFHFHRIFKVATGVTPQEYGQAHRSRKMRDGLHAGQSVTEAIYDAGYGSSSRFYEKSAGMLGMTPTDYRAGGKGATIRLAFSQCALGGILVAASAKGVCAILLGDDSDALERDLRDRFPKADLIGGDAEFEKLVTRVVGFIENPEAGFGLPLDIRGTAFQQRVWRALGDIPSGTTESYTDVARRIGAPGAVRAVAGACAANLLAVAIPCHRVVRNDGGLSGYRWGVDRKRALLAREAKAK